LVWATIAIAVPTAALVVVAWFQWCTSEKTDQTLRAGERAFVFVRHQGSQWTAAKTMSNQIVRSFIVEWENSGNSQTKNLTVDLYCIPPQAFVTANPIGILDKPTLTADRLLGPKQTIWGGVCNYTVDQLNLAKDKGYHLYVGAKANYFDIFDARHVTEYCIEITNISGQFEDMSVIPQGDLNNCGRNCADSECDKTD
jgi:hypothetical protein